MIPNYKVFGDIPPGFTGQCYVESSETTYYFLNGSLHREDGPCLIRKTGVIFKWSKHGERHRLDGPAVVYSDEEKKNNTAIKDEFYIHGKRYDERVYWNCPEVLEHKLKTITTSKFTK